MSVRAEAVLRSGSLWNLAGLVVPIVVAIACIPPLLQVLGPQRFGGLSLAWTIAGHFSLLDFGLSRAMTYAVATRLARSPAERPADVINTGLRLIFLAGIAMGLLFLVFAPKFVVMASGQDPTVELELRQSAYLLAFGILIVVGTSAFRGLLEAEQRFAAINLIRIPIGSLTTAGPLFAAIAYGTLTSAVAALVVARLLGLLVTYLVARHQRHSTVGAPSFVPGEALALTKYGGWTAVSAVLSPIMTYCDRFLIGVASLAAVSIYATVFDVMIKLLILPAAISSAMFPLLCKLRQTDGNSMQRVYAQGVLYILSGLGIAALALSLFANPLLALWIGKEFATQGAPLVPVLALGVVINGVAHASYAFLHAYERPDLSARVHLIEAPLYLILLVALLQAQGIVGAAWAWTARVSVDAIALAYLAHRVRRR